MHEHLSQTARQALEQAQHEARSLNQEFVGTEHLLLALLGRPGPTTRLLRQHHVDADSLRSQIRSSMPFSEEAPIVTGALPLSPKAQRVINSAVVLARSLREKNVSTRLLLAAIFDDSRASILKSLKQSGVDIEGLLRALAEKPTEAEA